MKITKRNGNTTMYDDQKIINSILKANAEVDEEELTPKIAAVIANEVFGALTEKSEIITTRDIRECMYELLCERGFPLTAKHYMEYGKK